MTRTPEGSTSHPNLMVADLYLADRALVSVDEAAHLDACAECREALGLAPAEPAGGAEGQASPLAPTPPLRALRPRIRWLAAAGALAAGLALAVFVRGPQSPEPGTPSSAAPEAALAGRAKGPPTATRVELAVERQGRAVPYRPGEDAPLHPGDRLLFLPADEAAAATPALHTPGHAVVAWFEPGGASGVEADPRTAGAEAVGFALDAHLGAQRVTVAYFESPPDVRALRARLASAWQALAPAERAGLPALPMPDAAVEASFVVSTAAP